MKPNSKGAPAPNKAATDNRVALAAPPILSDYLTPEQLASELDVSERTVHRWHAMRGGPPRVLIGRKPYYKRSSVAAWLDRQERDPGAASSRRRRA